jgi:hypothetical protein
VTTHGGILLDYDGYLVFAIEYTRLIEIRCISMYTGDNIYCPFLGDNIPEKNSRLTFLGSIDFKHRYYRVPAESTVSVSCNSIYELHKWNPRVRQFIEIENINMINTRYANTYFFKLNNHTTGIYGCISEYDDNVDPYTEGYMFTIIVYDVVQQIGDHITSICDVNKPNEIRLLNYRRSGNGFVNNLDDEKWMLEYMSNSCSKLSSFIIASMSLSILYRCM